VNVVCGIQMQFYAFDTARIVCGAGSMHLSGVRPSIPLSVRRSVCPTRQPHAAVMGLQLWSRRPGDIDRLLHGRRASSSRDATAIAGSATLSADVGSWTKTCCFMSASAFLFALFV